MEQFESASPVEIVGETREGEITKVTGADVKRELLVIPPELAPEEDRKYWEIKATMLAGSINAVAEEYASKPKELERAAKDYLSRLAKEGRPADEYFGVMAKAYEVVTGKRLRVI